MLCHVVRSAPVILDDIVVMAISVMNELWLVNREIFDEAFLPWQYNWWDSIIVISFVLLVIILLKLIHFGIEVTVLIPGFVPFGVVFVMQDGLFDNSFEHFELFNDAIDLEFTLDLLLRFNHLRYLLIALDTRAKLARRKLHSND